MDEIDALLADLDAPPSLSARAARPSARPSAAGAGRQAYAAPPRAAGAHVRTAGGGGSIDDLLAELGDVGAAGGAQRRRAARAEPWPHAAPRAAAPPLRAATQPLAPQGGQRGAHGGKTLPRCAPQPMLGGAMVPAGRREVSFARRCSALRCTRCDFYVVAFEHRRWVEGTADALFFRNAAPDAHRLAKGMAPAAGSVAYCCQCSWRTLSGAAREELTIASDVRWVCAGHSG